MFRKNLPALLFLSALYVLILLSSASRGVSDAYHSVQAKQLFEKNTETFLLGLSDLQSSINKLSSAPSSQKNCRNQFISLRNEYKKLEILLRYFDPQGVKDFINGAPLPSIERKVADLNVLEPSGLQVIEELLYAANPVSNKHALNQEITALRKQSERIFAPLFSMQFEDRHVFEAVLQAHNTAFTLSLSGFDNPGSQNGVNEAYAILNGSQDLLKPYISYYASIKANEAQQITASFLRATKYLVENPDFASFNRAAFYRDYLAPLNSRILKMQLGLEIETVYETSSQKRSIDYLSTELFNASYFNPYYYLRLEERFDNKHTQDLGRLLFFDPVLSYNNERSCASCHKPEKGFTDGLAKSIASDFEGTVSRNAPTVLNSTITARFFHDLRANHLEAQIEHVIRSHDEFRTDYTEIISKLEQSSAYKSLFQKAYPSFSAKPISKKTMSLALASYMATLNSFNSPFDGYMRKEHDTLSKAAIAGFNLFMGKALCGTCHFAPAFNGTVPPLYTESESEVLGVTVNADFENPDLDPDLGRLANGIIREEAEFYRFAFKTPTVRNVAITGPYFHNGGFNSLEDVVAFYNHGGGAGLGIDLPNQTLPFDSLSLTETEQAQIVAFMEALTDTAGLTLRPKQLPAFPAGSPLNNRKIGGTY